MTKEIGYLKTLQKAYGWKLLVNELQERVDSLTNEILTDFNKENNKVLYSLNDLRKVERQILKDFIEMPEMLRSSYDIIETNQED